MLVLTRKLGEKIWIGENVCITVVDIDRGKVRLGVEAPRDVPVYRQELLSPSDSRVVSPPVTDVVSQALASFAQAVDPDTNTEAAK